jgi:hypothetical protein
MRIAKEQVDVRMQVPGAVIRQRRDFGDATGYGKISGEFFTLSEVSTPRRCSRGWRATSASARTGAMCFPAPSPPRMPRG